MPDSLATLRHRWWLVALVTGLGFAAAGGWLQTRAPEWDSTTSVLVHPAGQDTNVIGGRTQGQVNLDTEAQLVRSTAVAAGAAERLGLDPPPVDLAGPVRVAVPPNTSVLTITFAAPTPAQAQAGAQAFAEAYLHHREQSARADLTAQMTAIKTTLDELDGTLTRLNERLAGTPAGTLAAVNLDSQRGTVVSQVNTLTDRLNELATATISPGMVISEARLPGAPSRPQPALVLASGTAVGLVAGVGAAGLGERLVRRVRRPADLSRRLGVPVLAAFPPATAPPRDEIASPYGPAGRAFDRLRNEVIAAAGPDRTDHPRRGRVIVVTSPTGGPAAGPVAANLAASLSRCGHDVILVEAAGAGAAGPLPRLLAVAAAPGLSELLAGRASVAEALQRPPRYPRLQAMTMGGTATATGLLQSPALRTVLAALAAQTGYVVVEAPATATSADAQSLASHADLALLAVETRRTRLADVADAAGQLQRVGTPLLGAVVVPPRRPKAAGWAPRAWYATRRSSAPAPDGGYEVSGRDGTARPLTGRPAVWRPRGTEAPAPRHTDDKLAHGPADGQTLVLARLVDELGAADRATPTDRAGLSDQSDKPERADLPERADRDANAAGAAPPGQR